METLCTDQRPLPTTGHHLEPGHACWHHPHCPPASAPDRCAARVVAAHPEQGWSLLCNGVIAFEDGGTL